MKMFKYDVTYINSFSGEKTDAYGAVFGTNYSQAVEKIEKDYPNIYSLKLDYFDGKAHTVK